MNAKPLLTVLILAAVALAGCSGGGGGGASDQAREGGADPNSVQLESGKGAISGLLVDDRFRPIDLTDNPTTEFQTTGFVLLAEEGLQTQTSENGEFSFVNLDPGSYTLRVQADGHETIPHKVTVIEGEYAEATVVARRVSSEGSFILTEEYSGYTPCAASWPLPGGLPDQPPPGPGWFTSIVFNCNDASGDSFRPGPSNLTYNELANDTTYMIVEMMVEKEGNYFLVVRHDDGTSGGGDRYGAAVTEGGRYAKVIMQVGEIYDEEMNANPLDLMKPLAALNFFRGNVEETDQDDPTSEGSLGQAGVEYATKTQFMISLFIGEPEVDLETYRLLSEESS